MMKWRINYEAVQTGFKWHSLAIFDSEESAQETGDLIAYEHAKAGVRVVCSVERVKVGPAKEREAR